MDTFDRFWATVSGAASLTKVSSADAEATERQARYPDSEFGLVVVSGARKARLFPMSTSEELFESADAAHVMRENGLLPERMLKSAADRMEARARSFQGEGEQEPALAASYWDERKDGYFWRERERQHAEKRSSAPAPEHPALAEFEVRNRTVSLRKLSDVAEAAKLLRSDGEKMSSAECRGVAKAIVQATMSLCGVGEPEAIAKLSSGVREYCGTVARPEAPYILREQAKKVREGRSDLLSHDAVSKISAAYDAFADNLGSLAEKPSEEAYADLCKVAEAVDQLNAASGLKATHAHKVVFLPARTRSFFKASAREYSDGYEYTFGSTTVRASELERLVNVNLQPLFRTLGREKVERFRDDPIGTFRSLTEPQKRAVARFCEETVKIRDMDGMVPTLL